MLAMAEVRRQRIAVIVKSTNCSMHSAPAHSTAQAVAWRGDGGIFVAQRMAGRSLLAAGFQQRVVPVMLLVMVWLYLQDPRFGEILSVAEGLDSENIKKAIRKSRVVFNRGGADEPQSDPGGLD